MRRSLVDLVALGGRRNTSSLRYRAQRNFQQRRAQSTESNLKSDSSFVKSEKPSADTKTTTTTPPASSAASSARAASPPLTAPQSRTVWEVVKASPVGRFGGWYSRVQDKRPYVTQMVSSLIVYLCGDLSAQLLFPSEVQPAPQESTNNTTVSTNDASEEQSKPVLAGYDPLRTLRHLTIGLISSIPSFKWFMFLHHNFNYSSKFLSILTKVSVQQAVFTPIFSTYFFLMQSLMVGATFEETCERLKRAVPDSIRNSVKLWPAVTAFSFMYVPPQFRAIFGGTIAVGWQTYLSWLNQMAAREVAAAETASVVAASQPAGHISKNSVASQAA
ncbi:hypothetical protein BGW36DRAFT_426291 [Talaromyces proteolyticus]|uniref:Uncharacterized protein n=1 Tax=Talaromyces proteolyticus TaxID=1131652 RepID=A0AAD4PZ33_9EURO|nr:uncharacterized protein BGW36DRAFT_426291 [Talaromyces proteolyticus]KAH8698591.1 hypothetical protein BGW36DRAFT_426291 [Talaromyces proteolyticus]